MKKVTHFLKRRIFPIMLALVIVFFSVVIPCSRVEASSIAVPAPTQGFSYYDLVSTAFLQTGFDVPFQSPDGSRSTFGAELWNDLCDTFDIWCYNNFGTTDADEIKDQFRALPGNIVDGCITMGKDLWNALYGFGADAYDYVSTHVSGFTDSDFIVSDACPYYSWSLVESIYGVLPSNISASNVLCYAGVNDPNFIIFKQYDSSISDYRYHLIRCDSEYYTFEDSFLKFYMYNSWQSAGQSYSWYKGSSLSLGYYYVSTVPVSSIFTNMSYVSNPSASNWQEVADANADVIWPKNDLSIEKVKNVTWEDAIASPDVIVPGQDAEDEENKAVDVIMVPLVDTGEDSEIIPGTDVQDPAIDNPAVDDPANDTVTDEELAGLLDAAGAAGDITKFFPFCIPFDIVALIKGMRAEEKPPVWKFSYYFKEIDYTFEFTVDMSDYETYIKIFRSGFIIFFIITLMLITIRFSSGVVKD